MENQLAIFEAEDGKINLSVQLDKETVWLNLDQMATVFQRDKSVISRHLTNVFRDKELHRNAVVAKNATTAADGKTYQVDYYNLDAIISVGYRVNSVRGTQFRIWATQVLRQHLVEGYTLNQRRLDELQRTVQLITNALPTDDLSLSEARGVVDIIRQYGQAMEWLIRYDEHRLDESPASKEETYPLSEAEAIDVITMLKADLMSKGQASDLFGRRRDETFGGILQTIYQSFGGYDLYPTVEEKAAHLLYFIIKNHPFADGNKRIGSFLFVWYLDLNGHLRSRNGDQRVNENALTALALLTAQSDPSEKELMINLIINLIS